MLYIEKKNHRHNRTKRINHSIYQFKCVYLTSCYKLLYGNISWLYSNKCDQTKRKKGELSVTKLPRWPKFGIFFVCCWCSFMFTEALTCSFSPFLQVPFSSFQQLVQLLLCLWQSLYLKQKAAHWKRFKNHWILPSNLRRESWLNFVMRASLHFKYLHYNWTTKSEQILSPLYHYFWTFSFLYLHPNHFTSYSATWTNKRGMT